MDDLSSVMIRSQNREAKVRKFLLVDQSGAEIRVTLWGNEVSSCSVGVTQRFSLIESMEQRKHSITNHGWAVQP